MVGSKQDSGMGWADRLHPDNSQRISAPDLALQRAASTPQKPRAHSVRITRGAQTTEHARGFSEVEATTNGPSSKLCLQSTCGNMRTYLFDDETLVGARNSRTKSHAPCTVETFAHLLEVGLPSIMLRLHIPSCTHRSKTRTHHPRTHHGGKAPGKCIQV